MDTGEHVYKLKIYEKKTIDFLELNKAKTRAVVGSRSDSPVIIDY